MAIPIPPDFDFKTQLLDPNEVIVRDIFGLNIDNWARFRFTIATGLSASSLQGASITDELKDAFRELGKCFYEVVCSLGFSNYTFVDLRFGNQFVAQKAIKDFYFHGGAMLDNLSRLVYIINVPDAVSAKNKKNEYSRRLIDRGKLVCNHARDIGPYLPHIDSDLIKEFVSIRQAMAHYWKIPTGPSPHGPLWPRDQLRDKAFAWPYDESQFQHYSGWQPILSILSEHLKELERVQDAVFGLLLIDLTKFEANNGVTIVEPTPDPAETG